MHLGNDISINSGAVFLSTKARIIIGDHVIFGPNVTVVTGDHRIDLKEKPINSYFYDESSYILRYCHDSCETCYERRRNR